MFEKIRDKMREKIRSLEYAMTLHAEEEMENDGFPSSMLKTEFSRAKSSNGETGEWKYLVAGKSLDDERLVVVAKLSLTGKLVIITIYTEDYEYEN